MTYSDRVHVRKDIQGLRGIAVLLVVIYHSGFGLPGGFVGVDMFFVISGFVITQLLVRELEQTGTILFRNFYARRARRLLPALALVTVAILGFSVLSLSPFGEQQQVAKTAQATTLFLANVYMFLENTYFALGGNPFRHMWTLAVEEQFYLILPLALLIGWKLSSRLNIRKQRFALAIGVTTVSIISFVVGALLSFGYRITPLPERFAFFGTPSRIWEFGLGVLIALVPQVGKLFKYFAPAIFICGVAAIVWSATRIELLTPFPGVIALVPVFGTVLLIVAGEHSVFSKRALSWRPLVEIGDMSYGLYLWHWPMIVFSMVLWPDSNLAILISVLLSFVIARLSLLYFENPIRYKHNFRTRDLKILLAGTLVVPLILTFLVFVGANTGYGLRDSSSFRRDNLLLAQRGCTDNQYEVAQFYECVWGSEYATKTLVVFGDSHVESTGDGVIKAATLLGYKVFAVSNSSCPFLDPSWERGSYAFNGVDCSKLNLKRLRFISEVSPSAVLIVNAHSDYLSSVDEPFATKEDLNKYLRIYNHRTSYLDPMISLVEKLSLEVASVGLMAQVPESTKFDFARESILKPNTVIPGFRLESNSRRAIANDDLDKAASRIPGAFFLHLDELFCPRGQCKSGDENGNVWYWNIQHLNQFGSLKLVAPVDSWLELAN